MQLRGVNHPGVMTTSVLTGSIRDDATLREEFMSLARKAATA
jgi:GTP cyclohydrolase I